jgi:hypothetical protein
VRRACAEDPNRQPPWTALYRETAPAALPCETRMEIDVGRAIAGKYELVRLLGRGSVARCGWHIVRVPPIDATSCDQDGDGYMAEGRCGGNDCCDTDPSANGLGCAASCGMSTQQGCR